MPVTHQIVFLYTTILLLAGVVCVIVDIKQSSRVPPYGLEPWHTKALDFCALFFGLFAVQAIALELASALFLTVIGEDAPWGYSAGFTMLATYLAVLVLFAVMRKAYPPSFQFKLSPSWMGYLSAFKWGFFYYLAALPLIITIGFVWQGMLSFLDALGHGIETPYQEMVEQLAEVNTVGEFAVLFLLIVVAAPVVEELVFRGVLYRFLKGRVKPWLALTISSLLFAVIHFNILQLLPLFLLGMLLGRAYERTGSLRVPVAFHAIFNFITTLNITIAPDILQP